jgi:hypothetical protein
VRDRDLVSIFYTWISKFLSTTVKEDLFYKHIFGIFAKNKRAVAAWAYYWIFYSTSLTCMFSCQYNVVLVTMAL